MPERAQIKQEEITRTIKGAAKAYGVPATDIEVERTPDGHLLTRVRQISESAASVDGWDEVLK